MSDPIPWPENSQTVCVVDTGDVAHRSIKCERFRNPGGTANFMTTSLAAKKGKTACLCLLEIRWSTTSS